MIYDHVLAADLGLSKCIPSLTAPYTYKFYKSLIAHCPIRKIFQYVCTVVSQITWMCLNISMPSVFLFKSYWDTLSIASEIKSESKILLKHNIKEIMKKNFTSLLSLKLALCDHLL